ncbi:hypothetical protein B0H10DRAFT_2226946 [Mycena sp. CBHHK59/15]|nr:hypothetical protein B0H10DRAFT_2226946 [Mycena sp. CBHHK59/15]
MPAKATAILYQCIARAVARAFVGSGKNDNKFWAEVDTALAMHRNACTMPGTEQIAAEITYNEDIVLYGQPDATLPVTTLQALDAWLVQVNSSVAVA